MSWRDQAARVLQNGAGVELNKPNKPPVAANEGVISVFSVPAPALSAVDLATERRRQRVLAMLTEHPTTRYAVLTDIGADPQAVIVTLAIRDRATCELRIPRAKYDGLLLLDLIEKHGATVH
jgi:hypothetical protein